MNFWIEVSSGDQAWIKKISNDNLVEPAHKRGLEAPSTNRYINFFKKVEIGDLVFSYLTRQMTETNDWKSAIVGISKINSTYYESKGYLYIDTIDDLLLPVPIKYKEIKSKQGYSEGFKKMINAAMQKYLFSISKSDAIILLNIHYKNMKFIKATSYKSLI